jgi:predicted RNA-binding protein
VIEAVPPDKLEAYWLAITQIEAQDYLVQLRVAAYPTLDKSAQRRTHREFHRLAYPRTHDSTEVLTTTELAKRLGKILNG